VIAPVTRPFCGSCDRVRLTADGQVRNCPFATTETDLRTLLRAGASDDQLAAARRAAVAVKPGHGISDPEFLPPARPMSAIGGSRRRPATRPRDPVQLLLGISTETLVALTAATASIPGSRPSSSTASRLSSDTNLCGPAWIST